MDHVKEIDNAITAHMQWFVRLRMAIETGNSEFKPEIVKTDFNCIFGKWLYADIPARYKDTELYSKIKDEHARFHEEAARILVLALNGQKEQALKAMELESFIRKVSLDLIMKLEELKKV